MYIRHLDTLCILFKEFRQRFAWPAAARRDEEKDEQQEEPCV